MAKNKIADNDMMGSQGMDNPFGGPAANAGDIVESLSDAQGTESGVTLDTADFPELQGKKIGDQASVTIDGVISDIKGSSVTIAPAAPTETPIS